MKTYITFGQVHYHVVCGVEFHKDVVAVIHHETKGEGDKIAFHVLRGVFHQHEEDRIPRMEYFPGGLVDFPIKEVLFEHPKLNEPLSIWVEFDDEEEEPYSVRCMEFDEEEQNITEMSAKKDLVDTLSILYEFYKSLPEKMAMTDKARKQGERLKQLFG